MEEKTLSSEIIYKGKIFDLRRDEALLSNNKKASREIIVHREVIAVIPILPDGNILMVEQFRTPAGRSTLEIPAGRLNDGEHPNEAVHRELREETGYLSSSLEKILSFYPAIGYSTELIHIYIARKLTKGIPDPDDDEIIENRSYPLEKALDLIQTGQVIDGKSILGLLYFERLTTLNQQREG